jgi:alcohol dehydrogenase class IV
MHALSHPVGAVYNAHHGTTNAVVMPAVLRFNRDAVADRLGAAAAYFGIAGGYDGLYTHLTELSQSLGVPAGLATFGVEPARIDELAAMAIEDPSAGGNPVELTLDAAKALYAESL